MEQGFPRTKNHENNKRVRKLGAVDVNLLKSINIFKTFPYSYAVTSLCKNELT